MIAQPRTRAGVRHRRVVAWSLALALATSLDAAAQTLVYLLQPPPGYCVGNCPGVVTAIDVDTPGVLWTAAAPASLFSFLTGAYLTPDGRFLVWEATTGLTTGTRVLVLFDVVTRQASTLPFPSAPPGGLPGLAGHPARAEVFSADVTGPVAVSPGGVRRLTCQVCDAGATVRGVSASGDRVLIVSSSRAAVIDTAIGLPLFEWSTLYGRTTLSRDGALVYEATPGVPAALRAYRVSDGLLAAEVTVPTAIEGLSVDPRTGDLRAFVGSSVTLHDGVSLAELRNDHAPWWRPVAATVTVVPDPDAPRLYVSSTTTPVGSAEPVGYLDVVDAVTMTSTITASFPAPTGMHPGVLLPAPRPAAPGPLAATVQGSAVSLLWSPVAASATTTRYVLEVGSAPGLSDIFSGLDVGLQTSFGASNVPPGTYYVRVRAGNYSGLGAPSNEVVVQVP